MGDGFILPERDLLRDKEKRQAQVNAKSHPLKNRFNSGVPNSGVSAVLAWPATEVTGRIFLCIQKGSLSAFSGGTSASPMIVWIWLKLVVSSMTRGSSAGSGRAELESTVPRPLSVP